MFSGTYDNDEVLDVWMVRLLGLWWSAHGCRVGSTRTTNFNNIGILLKQRYMFRHTNT